MQGSNSNSNRLRKVALARLGCSSTAVSALVGVLYLARTRLGQHAVLARYRGSRGPMGSPGELLRHTRYRGNGSKRMGFACVDLPQAYVGRNPLRLALRSVSTLVVKMRRYRCER